MLIRAAARGAARREGPGGSRPPLRLRRIPLPSRLPVERRLRPQPCVPERPPPAAAIDYLARDFAGFRQLLLNRLSVSMPNWQERHVPDALIAIIEAIAFVADRLSYELDAVTTEAYLATARRRISVRRHARLLDYPMHEGCNARAFLSLTLTGAAEFKLQAAEVLFAAPGNGEDGFVPGLVPLASLDRSRSSRPYAARPMRRSPSATRTMRFPFTPGATGTAAFRAEPPGRPCGTAAVEAKVMSAAAL